MRKNKDKHGHMRNQYHPAFCDAMMQILENDSVKYEYEREYNLNSMPNRIDFLVIKKDAVSKSQESIGKIFRKYNIFEYKSPKDQLYVDEYYVTMAYAYLYAHRQKEAEIEDITISFVRDGKPEKLIAYFEDHGFYVNVYDAGIYQVSKSNHIDMQIIVARELDDRYLWLKALTDRLTLEDVVKLASRAEVEADSESRKRIRSILDLVSNVNKDKEWMKEVTNMGAFRDLFNDEFEKKDKEIKELSEQLKSKEEQLQSKNEQLQSKDEQVSILLKEVERLKEALRTNKIAML